MSAEPFPASPFRFALVGAGRVGTAVAALLHRRGHRITGVASRSAPSAEKAAARLGAEVFDHHTTLPESEVVLVGAGDAAIEDVATALAPHLSPGAVIAHFAGSLDLSPLRPAVEAGAAACALHPVQACPSVEAAIARLPGSAWGITCPDALRAWTASLVREDLEGVPFEVAEDDRPLWHAASVMTSNGIAALMAAGESLLESIGLQAPADVLGPLAAGTVANASEGGGGGATLTGPVVRGDTVTIERHLQSLKERSPELLPAYTSIARAILHAASSAGRIDANAAGTISAILETKRSPRLRRERNDLAFGEEHVPSAGADGKRMKIARTKTELATQLIQLPREKKRPQVNGPSEERSARGSRGRIGLVPTMGALHEGHLSLVRQARASCDVVVVSIFVNPLQFDEGEDFDAYPRDEEKDLALAAAAGADIAFLPPVEDMYPRGRTTFVRAPSVGQPLEGQARPGHFDGVCTVVAALFNIVGCDRAFFGHKDAQQAAVVKRMVEDLSYRCEIVVCPTVREPDGLAMSSRNAYLSADERAQAIALYEALQAGRKELLAGAGTSDRLGDRGRGLDAAEKAMRGILDGRDGVIPEYARAVDPETFEEPLDGGPVLLAVAARVGRARLIDNLLVEREEA